MPLDTPKQMMLTDKWPAIRVFHLAGGCRAIDSPDGRITFSPPTITGREAGFKSEQFGAVYQILARLELTVLGVDFIRGRSEADGRVPPNWRVYKRVRGRQTPWAAIETADKWSQVSHPAYDTKNGHLWDLSRRISHQIRTSAWRIREISQAYADLLQARMLRGSFKERERFNDGYTWLAYLMLQSFLVDACVLRDYLAEFAARYHFALRGNIQESDITSMKKLLSALRKTNNAADNLARELLDAATTNGWLADLTSYRNLVVHSAPLASSIHSGGFAVTGIVPLIGTAPLPMVHLPIPDKPSEIMKLRSNGSLFENFDQQVASLRQAAFGEIPARDGLLYAHEVMDRLVNLAERLLASSPIAPKLLVITEKDIIGPIVISED